MKKERRRDNVYILLATVMKTINLIWRPSSMTPPPPIALAIVSEMSYKGDLI